MRFNLTEAFLLEVPVVQSFECLSVSCLITCHFMNGVMDSVEIRSLSALRKIGLAGGSAVLSLNSHLKVLLCRIGDNLAEQLSELRSMLCLFVSSLLVVKTNLGITLTECYSCHSQIHTYFRALTGEVCSEVVDDILAYTLSNAYNVLCSPCALIFLLRELRSGSMTYGTALGSFIALMYVAANITNILCHNSSSSFYSIFYKADISLMVT